LPDHYSIPEFYQFNRKKKQFIKIDSPFEDVLRASFLLFADFDRDGVKDIILITLNQKTELTQYPLRIFKGIINKKILSYHEIKDAFPKDVFPTASLVPFDYNLDGHLDLYQGNWYDFKKKSPTPVADTILVGNKFKFKRQNLLKGLWSNDRSDFRPTFGASLCDIDKNGWPDIVSASSSGFPNRLWINSFENGIRFYKDFGESSGYSMDLEGNNSSLGGGNSFFAICNDYNNDGIVDILMGELSHSYDNETRDRSSVLTGSEKKFPPRFIRTEYHMDEGTVRWNQGDRRGVWVDLNFDGLLDLIVDNSGFPPNSRLVVFMQEKNHGFKDVSKEWGVNLVNPAGTITLDVNRDGKPDILTGQTSIRNASIKKRVYLLENVIPREGNKSIKVVLSSRDANKSALGAIVTVHSKKQTQSRLVSINEGPQASQNENEIIFGLRKGDALKKITVRWPFLFKEKRNSNSKSLLRTYSVAQIKLLENTVFTLCESGQWAKSRIKCKPTKAGSAR